MSDSEFIMHLESAMGHLYEARYRSSGPEEENGEKHFPKMDLETVNAICHLQTVLQRLISTYRKKYEKTPASN